MGSRDTKKEDDSITFVLLSDLSYREVQECKKELMNTGLGNLWIEQTSVKKRL